MHHPLPYSGSGSADHAHVTGCIPIEATVDNVQLYFNQFGYVLDVYLAKDVKKICHRGFGFVTFADDSHLPGLPDIVLENAAPIANDMVAADPSSTVVHSL
ncbi:hypothetical protein RGQ29_024678 [Quercus rubra]|uniref:RRM domain-containing protein n=1 Tax=Quercus rubra TaxID=3512 RepID=A0AAN7EVN3_QUERU|nr:hypothetical protein RGQ29_024678 [Quercus rubra]